MSIALRPQDSPQNQLHKAICLLSLITARPADLDDLPVDSKEPETKDASSETEDDAEDLEDAEISNPEDEKKRNLDVLRNKVLDRLAETLARYKSDPRGGKGSTPDAKHVASTMMIMYDDEHKVKILCAKNEGLDQGKSTEDSDFLNSWKGCMERIARAGTATDEDKAYMFDLVLRYQQPRISYYVQKLREALGSEEDKGKSVDLGTQPVLSDSWLKKLPNVRPRTWLDDSGNEFEFLGRSSDEADNHSQAALSAQSLREFEDEVSIIFSVIDRITISDVGTLEESLQEALLKELLPPLFTVWRSVRFQALMKARLHTRFQPLPNSQRRQRNVIEALKFLCRCYYTAVTFIQAAETMTNFQNVEWVPLSPRRQSKKGRPKTIPKGETPLEVSQSLGLRVYSFSWIAHLEKQTTKQAFEKLRGEKCHTHAEIQMLYYLNNFTASPSQNGRSHPYIGCSKLCCLLCWLFIRIHGGLKARGSHETVVHRWEIPMESLKKAALSKFQAVSGELLSVVKIIIQRIVDESLSLRHTEPLAQSSAALSTTQSVLDREKAEMEKSKLKMRQMMMGQSIANDNVLICEHSDKPGIVSVFGGSLSKLTEMTLEEAEVYKENHIRGKFGLERTDEMPPKQKGDENRSCHRCSFPSDLHCSACRTRYCSKYCQKREWRRHVFVCTTKNRPNDVDYLSIILKRWNRSREDESTKSRILLELYSDNDLCKTFGFNNCFNSSEVGHLICLYGHMISKLSHKGLQVAVDAGNLGNFMETFTELVQLDRISSYCDCSCFTWFLIRRSNQFRVPNWEGSYSYQIFGLRWAELILSLEERDDEVDPLSDAEKEVLSLYSILLRDFNDLPGPLDRKWFTFGFCFCKNYDQRKELAKLYAELVGSGASIGDIAHAHESGSLSALMKHRGLDLSYFEENDIFFHMPGLDERGIYRLIAEVNHTLSGRFCYCFTPKPYCHPEFETHLSRESDGDYGFHGTNTWERWQLFNFYKYVFDLPNFDARKMQEAKRQSAREKRSDHDRLNEYLDSLVPDFKKKIGNWVLGDVMFPKTRASISFPWGRPECCCVMHNAFAPEGLNWGTVLELSQFFKKDPESENSEEESID